MLPVDGTLDAIFLGCFLFGLILSILTLLLGVVDLGFGHVGHGGGHVGNGGGHGGHGGHAGHDTGQHGDDLSLFNLPTILAFIAWFGGIGYLTRVGLGWIAALSVLVAVAGGLAGGFLIYQLLSKLSSNDGELDPDDYRLPGTIARVTSSIRLGGTGEIVYQQGGVRQVAAARSATGEAITRGTEVVVLRVDRGFALVEPWDELMESSSSAPETTPGQQDPTRLPAPDRGAGARRPS